MIRYIGEDQATFTVIVTENNIQEDYEEIITEKTC